MRITTGTHKIIPYVLTILFCAICQQVIKAGNYVPRNDAPYTLADSNVRAFKQASAMEEPRAVVARAAEAGTLAAAVGDKLLSLDSLIVEGPVNSADFDTMWRLAMEGKILALNLENAVVDGGRVPDFAFRRREQLIDGVFHILPIRSVVLGESVTEIGDKAFAENYELKYLTLPKSLRKLGNSSFYSTIIRRIELPEGISEIPEWCFGNCSMLTEARLPETLTKIGRNAFNGNVRLTEAKIPEGVVEIGDGAFFGCRLSSVELPAGCAEHLGEFVFRSNFEMTRLVLPEGMRVVPAETSYGAVSLTELTLPESLWYIEKEAFNGCLSLRNIEFPEGFEAAMDGAFAKCYAMEEIVFPSTTKFLGQRSFFDLHSLKRIYCKAVTPPWGAPDNVNGGTVAMAASEEGVFGLINGQGGTPRNVEVFVPTGSADAYRSALGWNYFTNFIETDFDPAGVESVRDNGAETTVKTDGNSIVIETNGATAYGIYSVDGRFVAGGKVSGGSVATAVPTGVYVVRTDSSATKIIIR